MSKLHKLILTASAFVLSVALYSITAYGDTNKSGIITGDGVNVRETPSTSANILTQLSKNVQVVILDSADGWYKVSIDNSIGWVNGQFISVANTIAGSITGTDVNFRKGPSTAADVISALSDGVALNIMGRSGEWFKVQTDGGSIGWVNKKFVALSDVSVSRGDSESLIPEIAAVEDGSSKQQVVSFAKKFMGVRYSWGGSSPGGFDCSGFVSYVYRNFGITLERVAVDQAAQGTRVSKGDLQLGDMVFFDTNGGHNFINHVGMYIGGGQFIHASSGAGRVTINSLYDGFYANAYITARRVLN